MVNENMNQDIAISSEETRYYLNGVYFHTVKSDEKNILKAVATDGHRLAKTELVIASSIEIEGIKIFGSPHTPQFGQWAFMKARHKLDRIWQSAIEDGTHIIVVHGPPKGMLDLSYDKLNSMEHCGDKSLMNKVKEVEPKLMLFGHIHNCDDIINAGTRTMPGLDTIFSNGSVVTDGKFGKLSSNGNIFKL
mgnify:CR=1 FL=1